MTDITVKQGETYSARLVLKDENGTAINLSGYTVSGASGSLYSSGYIDIDIASTVTATFPVLEANYEIKRYNSSGVATRTLYGNFLVAPGVTRIAESL